MGASGRLGDTETDTRQAAVKVSYATGGHQFKVGYEYMWTRYIGDIRTVGEPFDVAGVAIANRTTGGALVRRIASNVYRVTWADLAPSGFQSQVATTASSSRTLGVSTPADDQSRGVRFDQQWISGASGEGRSSRPPS